MTHVATTISCLKLILLGASIALSLAACSPAVATDPGGDPGTIPGAEHEGPLPPLDLACQSDADCSFSAVYVRDDGACCGSCTYVPVSSAWEDQALAYCDDRWGPDCPKKKCVAPPQVACVDGTCVAR